ncbi:hypothetical protein QBC41DRAFT_103067 [Cercophora samala]|uniref:Uncharacterized protein n=1 Tax=Cercophora samala TaxID=330535 RepID=A0AA39ZMD3_9PEZI|nr:hypothetical protein QBC41DRAFT_103067 [Cercophora samala]
MPPIPLHTNSPINPAKASGITPQTASPNSGAAPSGDQPTPTKTTSAPPQNGPPAPQPGAVPHLPRVTSTSSALPPPPQPAITPAPSYPPPPQSSIPPPELPYNQRGTSTAFTPGTRTGAAVLPGPSPYETGGGTQQGYQQRAGYQSVGSWEEEQGNEGVLGSVMGYAKAAGEKLSEAEREVWRRINGEK